MWRPGRSIHLARFIETKRQREAARKRDIDRARFFEAFGCEPSAEMFLFGRGLDVEGAWRWCGLPIHDVLKGHMALPGASGSGKSYAAAVYLMVLLIQGYTVVLLDLKSELTALMLELIIPALIAAGHCEGLLERIRLIKPFDRDRTPLLRVTQAERGTSRDVQALNLAASLTEAVGTELGVRMQRAFLPLASLAIERSEPLPVIVDWLRQPQLFAQLARTSADPATRAYGLHEFQRESQPSLDALRSRLGNLMHLEDVRLALSAPACIDTAEVLESGFTSFDLGSPPAGAESAMRFIGNPLLGRLTRAILSRPITPESRPVVFVAEEFQEILAPFQTAQFNRLLALARHKHTSVWLINQQSSQVAAVDPSLVRTMRTNVSIECVFRSSAEDAKLLAEGLALRRPGESLYDARQRFVEEVVRLPKREFFLWVKTARFGPQRLRSPRLDVAALEQLAARLPDELRQQIRIGTTSVDRAALLASLERAQQRQRGGPQLRPRPHDEPPSPLG